MIGCSKGNTDDTNYGGKGPDIMVEIMIIATMVWWELMLEMMVAEGAMPGKGGFGCGAKKYEFFIFKNIEIKNFLFSNFLE